MVLSLPVLVKSFSPLSLKKITKGKLDEQEARAKNFQYYPKNMIT
jgi:hypothetical protein